MFYQLDGNGAVIARGDHPQPDREMIELPAGGELGDSWNGDEWLKPGPTLDDYRREIQAHVDATAQQRSYDSGASLAGYATSTVPAWQAEAVAFVAWRDAVWVYAYTELEKVETEQRPQPSIEGFIAELPAMVWPA